MYTVRSCPIAHRWILIAHTEMTISGIQVIGCKTQSPYFQLFQIPTMLELSEVISKYFRFHLIKKLIMQCKPLIFLIIYLNKKKFVFVYFKLASDTIKLFARNNFFTKSMKSNCVNFSHIQFTNLPSN